MAGNLIGQAPLAQLAEQLTLNQWVVGSSPTWCTQKGLSLGRPFLFKNPLFIQENYRQVGSIVMKRFLGLTRFAVVVPAFASIIGALLLMALGSISMVTVFFEAVTNNLSLKETVVEVLTAVDAILLGTVLLVIGYGLYELFIDADIDVPLWLRVENLDDLKSKLIGVVVAIIAVVFVGVFVDTNRASEVISYGVGAGAIVTGLAIFAFATGKQSKTSRSTKEPK